MLPGILMNYYYYGFLLNHSLKSTILYCKASTKTQKQLKNSTKTQKQNTKEAKQKLNIWKRQYKRSSGTKPLNPETQKYVDQKIQQISRGSVSMKQWGC